MISGSCIFFDYRSISNPLLMSLRRALALLFKCYPCRQDSDRLHLDFHDVFMLKRPFRILEPANTGRRSSHNRRTSGDCRSCRPKVSAQNYFSLQRRCPSSANVPWDKKLRSSSIGKMKSKGLS